MGICINPGNEGFATVRRTRYVDKSGLIEYINSTIDTKKKLTCVSRPRRFGKTYAAQMLCAYYDKTCDSHPLFDDLKISEAPSYHKNLNRFDVIYIDMTSVMELASDKKNLASFVKQMITAELAEAYPAVCPGLTFQNTLDHVVSYTGNKFIAIIDEWDAPIRDKSYTEEDQKEYLEFLRMLFKSSNATDRLFAAAYMTGILPIKKDGSQSAVSEFREYTMLDPGLLAEYVGLTEKEVLNLCEEDSKDFEMMKKWYDGYTLGEMHSVYNPNSVIHALEEGQFKSFWKMSSAADSLLQYINMDFDGLAAAIPQLIAGIEVDVRVSGFKNDLDNLSSKDDVLTLLIHFGYLSYDESSETVRIPNEEIKVEFTESIRKMDDKETQNRVRESQILIENTVSGNADFVAAQIEKIHFEECSPLYYNNEQSLRSVIKLAYFAYKDYYIQLEELPSGKGYADIVYLPRQGKQLPALVIELKWNQEAEGAIDQIRKRNYPAVLKDFGAEILLVGISYNKDTLEKKHHCIIEPDAGKILSSTLQTSAADWSQE